MKRAFYKNALLQNVGDSLQLHCAEWASVGIHITGTFSGTISFFAKAIDNGLQTNLVAVSVYDSSTGTGATTETAPGYFIFPCAGFSVLYVQLTAVSSGSVNVVATVSDSHYQVASSGGGGGGGGDASAANQQTQITQLGSLTETAPTSDTASSGLNGRLQRIAQRLTSLLSLFPSSLGQKTSANSLAVTLASDQTSVIIKENTFTVSASFNRPADTVQYSVGDALSSSTSAGTQTTFSTVGAANQSIIIEKISIVSSNKGATLPQIQVWISGASMASATVNDNAALVMDLTSFTKDVNLVTLLELSTTSATTRMAVTNLRLPTSLDASGNLYAIFSFLNNYTPANSEAFKIFISGTLR